MAVNDLQMARVFIARARATLLGGAMKRRVGGCRGQQLSLFWGRA